MIRSMFSIAALGAGLFLAVAAAPGDASATARKAAASCEAAEAIKLIGAAAPDDASVRRLTGARTVRRVAPGGAVTMNYRPERVTLEIADQRVVSTMCG